MAPADAFRARSPYSALMNGSFLIGVSGIFSLLPAWTLSWRRPGVRGGLFWGLLAIAVAGPLLVTVDRLASGWVPGLALTLWVSMTAAMVVFAIVCVVTREGCRLTSLLLSYLLLFGLAAMAADQLPRSSALNIRPGAWIDAHILVSVAAYGLLTVAAIAALATFLQERSLKRRRLQALAGLLPAIAEAEHLQVRLMQATSAVLAVGVLTGMAVQFLQSGRLFDFNHKTLFVLLAFLAIFTLVIVHVWTGLRGRRAARLALLAYLLVTIAFPGVRFVTEVVLP